MPGNSQTNPSSAIPVYVVTGGGTPIGYQQITSLTAAVNLTPPAGATSAIIIGSGAAVRYRDDGTAPTATVGMPLAIATPLTYTGFLSVVQFIQQTSSATLDVMYYS